MNNDQDQESFIFFGAIWFLFGLKVIRTVAPMASVDIKITKKKKRECRLEWDLRCNAEQSRRIRKRDG